jgi:hydrogenase maturation protease
LKIIGCGTADRGDDAAGLLVARRLRELGVDACEQSGEGLALLDSWTGADAVVLIDAVMTGRPPGTLTVWNASDAPVVPDFVRCSTHAFGVAEAIRLARVLGRMPARMTIYGIEGRQFGVGSAPAPEVGAAVEVLSAILVRADGIATD